MPNEAQVEHVAHRLWDEVCASARADLPRLTRFLAGHSHWDQQEIAMRVRYRDHARAVIAAWEQVRDGDAP